LTKLIRGGEWTLDNNVIKEKSNDTILSGAKNKNEELITFASLENSEA
jgi:hypothetical protein